MNIKKYFGIICFVALLLMIPLQVCATDTVSDFVTKTEQGLVVLENLDGDNNVTYIYNLAFGMGDKLEVTFDFSVEQPMWVGIFGIQGDGAELEIGADIRENDIKGHSFGFQNVKGKFEALRIRIEFLDPADNWAQNVVTIRRFEIEDADTPTLTGSGTINIPNITGDGQVHYTFQQEASAGDELSFDLDVTPKGQKVTYYILGCDLRSAGWTNELYRAEIESWPKNEKQTVKLELKGNTSIFTIVVRFEESNGEQQEINTAKIRNIHISNKKHEQNTVETEIDIVEDEEPGQINTEKYILLTVIGVVFVMSIIGGVLCIRIWRRKE